MAIEDIQKTEAGWEFHLSGTGPWHKYLDGESLTIVTESPYVYPMEGTIPPSFEFIENAAPLETFLLTPSAVCGINMTAQWEVHPDITYYKVIVVDEHDNIVHMVILTRTDAPIMKYSYALTEHRPVKIEVYGCNEYGGTLYKITEPPVLLSKNVPLLRQFRRTTVTQIDEEELIIQ